MYNNTKHVHLGKFLFFMRSTKKLPTGRVWLLRRYAGELGVASRQRIESTKCYTIV